MPEIRIKYDLHTHTYYSHGKNSPRENVLRAVELGLDAVPSANMPRGICTTASGVKSLRS